MEYQGQYKILFSTENSLKFITALHNYLQEFRLYKDSKARIINYKEYTSLIKAGRITKSKYFDLKKGQYCVIIKEYYMQYTEAIDIIRLAKKDFNAGWWSAKGKW